MNVIFTRRSALGMMVASTTAPAIARAIGQDSDAFGQTFETRHRGIFGKRPLDYVARIAPIDVPDATGRSVARFVVTSYEAAGASARPDRPIVFVWGGGPGASSLAHHLRFMGPKRIGEPASGREPRLSDNPDALLDIADLVFVDPPGTGFSRVLPGGDPKAFYSVDADAAAIIALMDRWIAARQRMSAPVFVEGSSYGTVRAIRIGWELRARRPLAGVFLTANSAMIQETSRENGVLGPTTDLSAQAATAVFHGVVDRRGRTDEQIIEAAWRFGMSDYLSALTRIEELSQEDLRSIAARLEGFTGIPADIYLANRLVIDFSLFAKLLLERRGRKLIDAMDGRLTAPVDAAPTPYFLTQRPPLFETYLRGLGVTYDVKDYVTQDPSARDWDFRGPGGASSNDWPSMLAEQMRDAPRTRVYSANGRFDLLSTMGQARYLFSRTALPKDRVTLRDYPGGHGVYADDASSTAILRDLRREMTAYLKG